MNQIDRRERERENPLFLLSFVYYDGTIIHLGHVNYLIRKDLIESN